MAAEGEDVVVQEDDMKEPLFGRSRWWSLVILFPCLLPAFWRLMHARPLGVGGLCSDFGLGLLVFVLVVILSRWFRLLILLLWAMIQIGSAELLAAVGRLPSWQDLQYLTDPQFVQSSGAGLHLAQPLFASLLFFSVLLALLLPCVRPRVAALVLLFGGGLILTVYAGMAKPTADQDVASRYNPLHWLIIDAIMQGSRGAAVAEVGAADMEVSLRQGNLDGVSLLGEKRARNVLIIVLEGISGIYHPEVREAMGVASGPFQMEALAAETGDAMLVPDFVTHSHQTIRGLYALHCGDFSKLSYDTPKGMELQLNPERAAACLPARLRDAGWATHYLQGAPLQFMNKDRVMPATGFESVHGFEWFTDRPLENFVWGTTDPDFFAGAHDYLRSLSSEKRPWLLSLLTVATHQPFDAPQELIDKYGDRKIAAVARLDKAVADFLQALKDEGLLDSTLVLITADESHGYVGADWYSSWGTMMVLEPESAKLPRLKRGTYGLVDVEISILDYLRQPVPDSVVGRSFFRDYSQPREMVSYTSGKLRWQTADSRLFECSVDGKCQLFSPSNLLAPNRTASLPVNVDEAPRLFGLARVLDHRLTAGMNEQRLQFGNGEIRELPPKIRNEWADNLVGAQYLDFPAGSRVDVDIRIKALTAGSDGIQLKLVMRQFEHEVGGISHPPFPVLHQGEDCEVRFSFANPEPRKAFSFHLVGEGAGNVIRMEKFEVAISRR